MITMLSCFHLHPGIDVDELSVLYTEFVASMERTGLIVGAGPLGRRECDTPMDTDSERDHEFFGLMSFRDRAQLDAAYDHILKQAEPGRSEHQQVFRWVDNPVFICWRDETSAPDAARP